MELMVVIGITSGLSLAVMTMLYETSRINEQMKRQSEYTRDLQSFYYALEQYISQTTQVLNCACQPRNAQPCYNDALLDASPQGGSSVTVLDFVYEDAADPLNTSPAAGSGCIPMTLPNITGTTIPPLGCKKELQLVYLPAQPVNGSTPSVYGSLQLNQVNPPVASPIAQINNVTGFGCGMSSYTGGGTPILSNSDFRVRIEVKSRQYNSENVNDPNYESWTQLGPSSSLYSAGIFRTHSGQIMFRNLNIPGVHFGKMRSYKNCLPNGATPPTDGSGNWESNLCCSGYASKSSNQCIPAQTTPGWAGALCKWNGGNPIPAVQVSATNAECCSRMSDRSRNCL